MKMNAQAGQRRAMSFVAEIDQAELTVRLMEIAIGLKRAGDVRPAHEIIAAAKRTWPSQDGAFPFDRMATVAIEYFRECVNNGSQPS